jgi:hypothetical protein
MVDITLRPGAVTLAHKLIPQIKACSTPVKKKRIADTERVVVIFSENTGGFLGFKRYRPFSKRAQTGAAVEYGDAQKQ